MVAAEIGRVKLTGADRENGRVRAIGRETSV
jgi:hypothetical protein